jgi:putative modification methyltransferase
MGEWKKVRIGKIFHLEKGCLQSSKCIQGKYDFITAAKDWKTHNTYTHDCEAIVYAVAASGSLGQAHYINGKFIASDLCLILTEKDKTKYPINFLFYQIIFESLRDEVVSKTKTGTSKEAISQKNFSAYEIPYFSIDFQNANYQRLINAKKIITEINKEIEAQKLYVKQLRRNILQDAIEGKLTADWRKEHPVQKGNPDYDAEALFELIQKERKVDKKRKTLPPILDAEKPFELPTGWKWVRLGEITTLITDGKHGDSIDQVESGYFFLSVKDIQNEQLIYANARQIIKEDFLEIHRRTNLEPGDVCIVNTGATIGKFAIAPDNKRTYYTAFQKSVAVVKLEKSFVKNKYMKYFFMRDVSRLIKKSWGSAINNLLLSDMRKEIVPLPPWIEQDKIVLIVGNILKKVDQLEQQISRRKEYTNELIKSILKKGF